MEFIANATGEKMVEVTPLAFVRGQLMLLGGPTTAAVAVLGLGVLMASPASRRFRLLGWIYVAVFLLLMASPTGAANHVEATSILPECGRFLPFENVLQVEVDGLAKRNSIRKTLAEQHR